MGNTPSEANGARCGECGRNLPAMTDWKDLTQQDYPLRGNCYVFFGGQYYRPVGGQHLCPDCFFRPQREAEQRRQEEERRRQEREAEFRRQQEKQKRQEQEQRRREAEERLRREREEEERRRREEQQRAEEERLQREQKEKSEREQEEARHQAQIDASSDLLEDATHFKRQQFLGDTKQDIKVHVLKTVESPRALDEETLERAVDLPWDIKEQEVVTVRLQMDDILMRATNPDGHDFYAEMLDNENMTHNKTEDIIEVVSKSMNKNEVEVKIALMKLSLVLVEDMVKDSKGEVSRELVRDVFWSHSTRDHLTHLFRLIHGFYLNCSDKPSVEETFCSLLLSALSLEYQDGSMFKTAHKTWLQFYWNHLHSDQLEIARIFDYMFSKGPKHWPNAQIWECTKMMLKYPNVFPCFRMIPQFAILPNQPIRLPGKQDMSFMDGLRTAGVSDPQKFRSVMIDQLLKEGDLGLDSLLASMNDTCTDAEKQVFREKLVKVVEILEAHGYPKDNLRGVESFKASQDYLEILALCAMMVRKHFKYWPRIAQLLSCVIMLSKHEHSGALLEINTGEGKSTIISMVAASVARFHKRSVDVVTSSPILATRDALEWKEFYADLGLTVADNVSTSGQDDEVKKVVYQADVVYGTVSTFAGDLLRHDFKLTGIRGERHFDFVIADEVDSMLVDEGIQFNYLSHNLASCGLRHLEPLLALVWSAVSSNRPLVTPDGNVFFRGPPDIFFKSVYDILDGEEDLCESPLQLLQLAHEECGILTQEDVMQWDTLSEEQVAERLKQVTVEDVVRFFQHLRQSLRFEVYTLNEIGEANLVQMENSDQNAVDAGSVLVLPNGLVCILSVEELLLEAVKRHVSSSIPHGDAEAGEAQLDIPVYLRSFARGRVSAFVKSGFTALSMREGREYLCKDDAILPIDFKSTGVVEMNKKWGNGLHQFLEMKHRLRLSPLALVTNFMSNVFFFRKYRANILGVSGTLGTKGDQNFMNDVYKLKFYTVPTSKTKKLQEHPGIMLPNEREWKQTIGKAIKAKIDEGRALLVICEDITSLSVIKDYVMSNEIYNGDSLPIVYARSDDPSQLNMIKKELSKGGMIIATNLAGRGTDIKVTSEVLQQGGLHVIVTFLPTNHRVELQAFGRAGRKGQPGSAQVIANQNSLSKYLRGCTDVAEAKVLRNMMEESRVNAMRDEDIDEVLKKEVVFAKYCSLIKPYMGLAKDKTKHLHILINSLHETWALWLLENENNVKEISSKAMCSSLEKHLQPALRLAADQTTNESPYQNFYHVLLFGAHKVLEGDQHLELGMDSFKTSIAMNDVWSSIAHYNLAYCIIRKGGSNYLSEAKSHLEIAQQKMFYYKEEVMKTVETVNRSFASPFLLKDAEGQTGFKAYIDNRAQLLQFWNNKIQEAVEKIDELVKDGKDAIAEGYGVFSLINEPSSLMQELLYEHWQMGLLMVFTVKEKPRFCWSALLVFFIGICQVVGGALLTAFTAGTMANIGMGLIAEGVSDMVDGIIGMATGEFSWKEWGISKAIGFGVSIASGGISKMVAKTSLSAVKTSIKQAWNTVKAPLKKVLDKAKRAMKAVDVTVKYEVKGGLSVAMKSQLKETAKLIGKEMLEQGIMYGVQTGTDALMEEMTKAIEKEIRPTIIAKLKADVRKDKSTKNPLVALLPHDQGELTSDAKRIAIDTAVAIAQGVVEPYYIRLSWKNRITNVTHQIVQKLKSNQKMKKYSTILFTVEVANVSAAVADAAVEIKKLCDEFLGDLNSSLVEKFGKTSHEEKSDISETELNSFLDGAGEKLGETLSQVIFAILHQRATSNLAKMATSRVSKFINKQVDSKITHSSATKEKIRLANDAFYISHMTGSNSRYYSSNSRAITDSHATAIVRDENRGGLVDLKVLADAKNIHVELYIQNKNGSLQKLRQISPSGDQQQSLRDLNDTPEKVKLLYHPPTKSFPDGHFDAIGKGNKIIYTEDSKRQNNKSCLFEAFHLGRTNDSFTDVANAAKQLRLDVGLRISSNTGRYVEHIAKYNFNRQLGTVAERYMAVGGGKKGEKKTKGTSSEGKAGKKKKSKTAKKVGEEDTAVGGSKKGKKKKNSKGDGNGKKPKIARTVQDLTDKQRVQLREQIGQIDTYGQRQSVMQEHGLGTVTNQDHMPAYSCVRDAVNVGKPSALALALAGGQDFSKSDHGKNMMTRTVMAEHHRFYLSTGSSVEAAAYRKMVIEAINSNRVEDAFKYTVIGTQTNLDLRITSGIKAYLSGREGAGYRMLKSEKDLIGDFSYYTRSAFSGANYKIYLDKFEEMVKPTGLMTPALKQELSKWIDNGGYNSPSDKHWKEICVKMMEALGRADKGA